MSQAPNQVTFVRPHLTEEEQQLLDQLFVKCHARNVADAQHNDIIWRDRHTGDRHVTVPDDWSQEMKMEKQATLDNAYRKALVAMDIHKKSQSDQRVQLAADLADAKRQYDTARKKYESNTALLNKEVNMLCPAELCIVTWKTYGTCDVCDQLRSEHPPLPPTIPDSVIELHRRLLEINQIELRAKARVKHYLYPDDLCDE